MSYIDYWVSVTICIPKGFLYTKKSLISDKGNFLCIYIYITVIKMFILKIYDFCYIHCFLLNITSTEMSTSTEIYS